MDHTQVYQNLDLLVKQKFNQSLYYNLCDGIIKLHFKIDLDLWPVESQLGKAVGLHTGCLESRLWMN